MNVNIVELLKAFSGKTGLPGRESEAAAYGGELLLAFGPVSNTPSGSVLCRVRDEGSRIHLLLDAHIDEVGLIVTFIEDSGFLRVERCGGIDIRALPAAPVVIHAEKGRLFGVVCSTPPHLDKGGEKKLQKAGELYIDTGLTGERARELISPGNRITLVCEARELAGGYLCGKALDDRACCAAIIYALSLLRGEELNCDLTVSFSAMEEVGGQGAKTAAYSVNPTHAVVLDVSFAHTHDSERHKCGEAGKGPMIGVAPILSHEMSGELAKIAKAEGIPHQTEVMGGRTGTNADQIASSRGGVKTAMLSIPLKYMHTPVETVLIKDVEDTARLLAAFIRRLGRETPA
ncbi:MAG: M20/M25/M40 family metallo-hydrolase [Oscillospiraceae bacterium]|jgi:endoglucanase|nr:M20/M25/M40 family metallo-hydrolase [Oscillospiraceae bacterium]